MAVWLERSGAEKLASRASVLFSSFYDGLRSSIPVLSPSLSTRTPTVSEGRQQQVGHRRVLRVLRGAGRPCSRPAPPPGDERSAAASGRAGCRRSGRCRRGSSSGRAAAVAVRRGAQLLEEIRQLRDVVGVDLRQLRELLRVVLVVRERVVRLGHADRRVGRGCSTRGRSGT